MDTNKLFERYLRLDMVTRDMLFARLFGRMEKSSYSYGSEAFFKELEQLLNVFDAAGKKETQDGGSDEVEEYEL